MSSPTAHPPVVLFTNSVAMGGMEEHLLLLGRELVRRDVRVAAICPPYEVLRPLRRALAEAGVEVEVIAERQSSRFGAPRRLLALARMIRRYRGCILHLHLTGHTGGELVVLAGRLGGARAIVRTEHLPPVGPIDARERLRARLRDALMARVICVSSQTRQDHLDRLGRDARKCAVVPNCVDLARFSPGLVPDGVHAELGLEPRAPIVGTVSRMGEHRKGLSYFLEMAAAVATDRPEARFVIVGDGPLRPELEAQAAQLGIAERVVFTGERQDIPRLLAAMRVFVMPSLFEGGPYTVLEAMAMERPVVATPVGLVPDAIDDGETGLLVPIADSAALADSVLRVLTDGEGAGQMARRGRERVVERFSLDAMVEGVIEVYRDAAGRFTTATESPTHGLSTADC